MPVHAVAGAAAPLVKVILCTSAHERMGISALRSRANDCCTNAVKRTLQYSYNFEAAYCAEWYLDSSLVGLPGETEPKKILVDNICFTRERNVTQVDGTVKLLKEGCAHMWTRDDGVVTYEARTPQDNWYFCRNSQLQGEKRQECEDVAFALNLGYNATLLKEMIDSIQVRTFLAFLSCIAADFHQCTSEGCMLPAGMHFA